MSNISFTSLVKITQPSTNKMYYFPESNLERVEIGDSKTFVRTIKGSDENINEKCTLDVLGQSFNMFG